MTDSMRASIGYGQCILLVSKVTNDLRGIVFLWCHYDPFVQHSSAFSENALKILFATEICKKMAISEHFENAISFFRLKVCLYLFFSFKPVQNFPGKHPSLPLLWNATKCQVSDKKLTRNWFDRISSSLDRCCLGLAKSWKRFFFRF